MTATWDNLPDEIQNHIQQTLAGYPRQLEAWKLELTGRSQRSIATIQDCSRVAVSDRLAAAHRRLHAAGLRQNAHGRFSIERNP